MYDRVELGIGYIFLTTFSCCLITGLILTLATPGGIAEGSIPLTIAGCLLVGILIMYIFFSILNCFNKK
jgi:hypothetical protein